MNHGNADKTRPTCRTFTNVESFSKLSVEIYIYIYIVGKINFFFLLFQTISSRRYTREINNIGTILGCAEISGGLSRLVARCLVGPRCVRRCRGRACASTCAIAAASGYAATQALGRRVAPGKRARGRPCTTLPPPMIRPAARPTAEITCYHPGSKVGRVLPPPLSFSRFSLFFSLERSGRDVSYFSATSFPLSKELEELELYFSGEKRKAEIDRSFFLQSIIVVLLLLLLLVLAWLVIGGSLTTLLGRR